MGSPSTYKWYVNTMKTAKGKKVRYLVFNQSNDWMLILNDVGKVVSFMPLRKGTHSFNDKIGKEGVEMVTNPTNIGFMRTHAATQAIFNEPGLYVGFLFL